MLKKKKLKKINTNKASLPIGSYSQAVAIDDFIFSSGKISVETIAVNVNKKKIIFGIQGGKGSFNEEALLNYVSKKKIKDYQVKYLYTTEKVLKNLYLKNIDLGIFAVKNSITGVVMESARAASRYKFKVIDRISIPIRHFLMKRKEVRLDEIDSIMAHPQVLLQCKNNLEKKYSHMKLTSGKGDLIDTAKAASFLAEGKISDKTAILGNKRLAEIFDLEIVDENLQDLQDNQTTFFVVARVDFKKR